MPRVRPPWYRPDLLRRRGPDKFSWLGLSVVVAMATGVAFGLFGCVCYVHGRSWSQVAACTGYGLLLGFLFGVWITSMAHWFEPESDLDYVPPPDWISLPVVLITLIGVAILYFLIH